MFTGIIEQIGTIKEINQSRFVITHHFKEPFEIGESMSCNGACMTMVDFDDSEFSVDIIEESRNLTTFGSAKVGDLVNLERSAIIGQRNSGHNVTGHIDQVGNLLRCSEMTDQWTFRVGIKPENRKLIVYKGSIAIEGVSLTISNLSGLDEKEHWFEISLIPHTFKQTNFNQKIVGQGVNLEFDILGKYLLNQDDFDDWNQIKKQLDKTSQFFDFKERHILFMSLGKNIGFEQDGKGPRYLRPVVVIRKFNKRFFWGIPLTSKKPTSSLHYYCYIGKVRGKDNWAILSQGRPFDIKRVNNKLGLTPSTTFETLKTATKNII